MERLEQKPQTLPVWPDVHPRRMRTGKPQSYQSLWKNYLAKSSEADLAEPVSYQNSKGETWSSRKDDILMHLITHSAYHRGQVAMTVRAAGSTPAYTDFIHSIRQGFVKTHDNFCFPQRKDHAVLHPAILHGADRHLGGGAPSGRVERGAPRGILYRCPGRRLALYRALAVGKVVFCDPAGARTCNLGLVFKDQEPDLRVQRVAAAGRPDCFAVSLRAPAPAGADSRSDHPRPPGGKGSRSQIRRGVQELSEKEPGSSRTHHNQQGTCEVEPGSAQ